jgi:hypothetical protein
MPPVCRGLPNRRDYLTLPSAAEFLQAASRITGAPTAQLASSESRAAAVTSESRPFRLHTLSRQAVRGPVQSLKAARGIHALVPREFAERQIVRPRLWAWMPRSCRWSSLPLSQWAGTGQLVPENRTQVTSAPLASPSPRAGPAPGRSSESTSADRECGTDGASGADVTSQLVASQLVSLPDPAAPAVRS